jgi:CubicO group peptidase (beta-lactamase class C family)
MKKSYYTILLTLIQLTLFAQKSTKLDSLFNQIHTEKGFNGNVLITEKDKVIYKGSFGFSDEESKIKLNENSIFELASISKQFTAMGIVILKEKSKLNYEDEISKYLPKLSFYKGVTIKNLLTHTSGLPDYMQLMDSLTFANKTLTKNLIVTNKDIIEIFSKNNPKLKFKPNEKYEYSNTGYALLASIIEEVSGKSYSEFLFKEIFKPLKMNNTFIYRRRYEPKKIKNYAFGYVYDENLQKNVLPDSLEEYHYVYNFDGIVGDGTVNSTANDLFLWDKSLKENSLVSQKATAEIFKENKLDNNQTFGYGFGWNLDENGLYGKIAYHGGSWPGYKTYIERHLENDKLIILLQNNDNSNIWFPTKQIREILYNIKPISYITLDSKIQQGYSGNYEFENGIIREITFENGKLYVKIYDDKLELQPISNNKFHLIGFSPDVFLEFNKNNEIEILKETQPEKKIEKEAMRK